MSKAAIKEAVDTRQMIIQTYLSGRMDGQKFKVMSKERYFKAMTAFEKRFLKPIIQAQDIEVRNMKKKEKQKRGSKTSSKS